MAKAPEEGRCLTGIEGLDQITGGGFPLGGLVHISGSCGSGKTSLANEFLLRGAREGQKAVFITTVHSVQKMLDSMSHLEIFDERLVKDKALRVLDVADLLEDLSHPGRPIENNGAMELLSEIEGMIGKQGAKRLAIDSISPLLMEMEPGAGRNFMKKLAETVYAKKCTTVVVSDCEEGVGRTYVPCDGLIKLSNLERQGNVLRVLQVLKMQGAAHSRSRYVFDVTSSGMLLTPMLRGGFH
jgi:circadian clock protein KaiC